MIHKLDYNTSSEFVVLVMDHEKWKPCWQCEQTLTVQCLKDSHFTWKSLINNLAAIDKSYYFSVLMGYRPDYFVSTTYILHPNSLTYDFLRVYSHAVDLLHFFNYPIHLIGSDRNLSECCRKELIGSFRNVCSKSPTSEYNILHLDSLTHE